MKKFQSLQYKFLIYCLIISIIPVVLIGVFCYFYSSKILIQNIKNSHKQKFHSVASNIDTVMSQVNDVSHLILQNQRIKNYLLESDPMPASSTMMDFLSAFVGHDNNISSIYIKGHGSKELLLGSSSATVSLSNDRLREVYRLDGYYLWYLNTGYMQQNRESYPSMLTFARLYKDIYHPSDTLGVVAIDVPLDVLEKTYYNQLSYDGSVFLIVNKNNDILLSNNKDYIGQRFKSNPHEKITIGSEDLGENYLMTKESLTQADWALIDLTPMSELMSENQFITTAIVYAVMGCIVICILLSVFISVKHLSPLRSLCQLIQDAGEQDFKTYTGKITNDEIGILASKFNSMSDQLKTLIHQVYVSQLKQSEAELNALQAQINPHFLYNTLDTIYWMAHLEKAFDAAELTKALSDMFRLNLNNGNTIIAFSDELKYLKNYLIIQEKRHKNYVTVHLDIDPSPELMSAGVIKLILQPFVENSFVHGIDYSTSDNLIEIQVKLKNNTVYYYIKDNGVGMSESLLKELNNPNTTFGFGVRSANKRIKLLFGDEYGIHVESNINHGTLVTVTQPYISEKERSIYDKNVGSR